jgi:hypothetical protein
LSTIRSQVGDRAIDCIKNQWKPRPLDYASSVIWVRDETVEDDRIGYIEGLKSSDMIEIHGDWILDFLEEVDKYVPPPLELTRNDQVRTSLGEKISTRLRSDCELGKMDDYLKLSIDELKKRYFPDKGDIGGDDLTDY